MPLNPKPYTPTDLIINAEFRGKPNVLADVDINRNDAIMRNSSDVLWQLIGPKYNTVFTTTTLQYNATGQLVYEISWTDFSIVIRGMQFNIGAATISGTTTTQGKPGVRVYLVATKSLITFVDNPIMSGVNSADLPAAMASADHYQYSSPRLAFVEYPSSVTLGPNEEVVTPVFTVIPQTNGLPKLYPLTNSAYSDLVKTILGDKFDGLSLVELNLYVTDFLLNNRGIPVGGIIMYDDAVNDAINFDNTGLGIGKWVGWAKMNGANGTLRDYRSRSPIGHDARTSDPGNGIWDPAYNVLGGFLGNKQDTLTTPQIPIHDHDEQVFTAVNNGGRNPVGFSGVVGGSFGPSGFRTGTAGGGQPHNTVHPVFVVDFVKRLQ